ncbi:MAG: hypothetical protein JJU19_13705 [Pararhodobacter sp.]|nr:hypothetical protein [Pararhodobacter sp.]
MNRKQRRAAVAMGPKSGGLKEWAAYLNPLCDRLYNHPLTPSELVLSAKIVAAFAGRSWYHGGAIGRAVGDLLLPASETGADPRNNGDRVLWRRDFVYITDDLDTAILYAKKAPGLTVYRVQPVGTVQVDPAHLRAMRLYAEREKKSVHKHLQIFRQFTCRRAEVLEVLA